MSRRRLTLATYARRRWRPVGAVLVLLLGSLLVLAVTDRGHDPLWEVSGAEIYAAAVSPDADAAYALLGENGEVAGVVAVRGADGTQLWEGRIDARRALLAAAPSGAAVATDFPLAVLTVYGVDGSIRWQLALEGSPVAMVMEGDRIALALNAPQRQNPVLVFEGEHLVRTLRHAAPVRALDMAGGLVATATFQGEVVVHRVDGRQLVDLSLPLSPRSIRLAHDGTALVVGGHGLAPSDSRGHVAFVEISPEPVVRWQQQTLVGVGLVDIDAAGLRALAVEESPPSATLHVYDGATGGTLWTRLLEGSVARDDAGHGAAALSPDSTRVAVGTVRGNVRLYDAATGEADWDFRASGATFVTFAQEDPDTVVVAGRLLANRPVDSLMMFAVDGEPLVQRAAVLAVGIMALAALVLVVLIGVGYWRARGSY